MAKKLTKLQQRNLKALRSSHPKLTPTPLSDRVAVLESLLRLQAIDGQGKPSVVNPVGMNRLDALENHVPSEPIAEECRFNIVALHDRLAALEIFVGINEEA